MYKIISDTEKIAIIYLKEFGFEDADIAPLLKQANIDLERELNKLEKQLNSNEIQLIEINNTLHALKGLLFQVGNHDVADKIQEFRYHIVDISSFDEIRDLLLK